MAVFEFDDVGVVARAGRQETIILDHVDVTLAEHRVALIGSNGSGKSTLARLFNGLVTATSGQVRMAGRDIATHAAEVRRRVGFVFTQPTAQLVMPTVAEDVALSLRRGEPDRARRDRRVHETLAGCGLAHLAARSVHALSGGQQQMLALAGVLATEPEVVVADEPTTLLDLRNARDVADRLFALDQQLVLVTHDLDLASRCDRGLVIDGGRVMADETGPDAVAAYRRMVQT